MKVSELAHRVGVSPAAVRFYESEGFLPAAARSANGYRDYDEADVCRLRVMTSLRGLGVELAEASRLARLCSEGSSAMYPELGIRIDARRAEVARTRADLDHLESELSNLERALAAGEACELLCPAKEGCC